MFLTITNIIFAALGLAMFGGLWNRIRGGGQESVSYEPIKKFTHQQKRIILALVIAISYYLPFLIILNFNPLNSLSDWIYFAAVFLVSFAVGLLPGWGSWFFVGRAQNSWTHNPDAIWAEYISFLRYGKKWIPANWRQFIDEKEYLELKKRFNLMNSPTGEVRPLEWRIAMEKFAMSVRGLGFSIPAPTIVALHLHFNYNVTLLVLPIVYCTGWAMGWCYDKINHLNRDLWPDWLQSNTQLGEFLSGAIVMTGLPFLVISISLLIGG